MVPLHLTNVLHVPSLCHNLLSLRVLEDKGHTYVGNQHRITLNLSSGRTLFAPSCGRLNLLSGYRKPQPNGVAFATIAPGALRTPSKIDINIFHVSHDHAHEGLLRATAKNLGVTLVERLEECKGCSMAKGIARPTKRNTHSRAIKMFDRVFVDIYGKKKVSGKEGKKYILLICDDYSRFP